MISLQIKPWVAFGLPYLLIELFYIGMPVVRTDGLSLARSVYGHVITKFSRMGRLPQFLSYGAPPTRGSKRRGGAPLLNLLIFWRSRCRRRNLRSSYLNTKDCKQGVLTIYTNHPGGNLVHKLKAVKFDVVRDNPPQLFKSAQKKTELGRKIAAAKITAHVVWSFPNGMARTISFSNRNFRFSLGNSKTKYTWFTKPKISYFFFYNKPG